MRLIEHESKRDLATSVAHAILMRVSNGRPLLLYTSASWLSCRIMSELGQMSELTGNPGLSTVSVRMIDEYEKLSPMHDQSRYYSLARIVSEWPDCYYADAITSPMHVNLEHESATCDTSKLIESNSTAVAVIDMSADGVYELLIQSLAEPGKPRYIALPLVLIDQWSRMFERYANTPTRVFVIGWESFLLSDRVHILCSDNSSVDSVLALLASPHLAHHRLLARGDHVTVHAYADRHNLLRLRTTMEE